MNEFLDIYINHEVSLFSTGEGTVIIPKEKYAFWVGPYKTSKTVKVSDGLMVGFGDIEPYGSTTAQNRPDFKQNNDANLDVSDEVIRRKKGE